jgi:hypothetical protein
MKLILAAPAAIGLLLLAARPGDGSGVAHASIERVDLREMMQRADGAVFAEIVGREVFFAPERDGPGLYFTRLTLAGLTLRDGYAIRVDVLHVGGVLDELHGAWSSEAPSADDTALGTRVVAFYSWVDDLGGGVAGNALYGAQGGLYRTAEGPLGATVLGRGAGFAVAHNVSVPALGEALATLAAEGR